MVGSQELVLLSCFVTYTNIYCFGSKKHYITEKAARQSVSWLSLYMP